MQAVLYWLGYLFGFISLREFYMKCENKWIKGDDSNKMLDKMIHEVKIKPIKHITII